MPKITRRCVLGNISATAAVLAGASACTQMRAPVAGTRVDHLILGVADLNAGIDHIEHLTGVRAAAGGTHPGRGTRNALLSLGEGCYLEIFAPDPAQSVFDFPIDLRRLRAPTLVNWAVSGDVEACAQRLRKLGEPAIGPRAGSRARPDGKVLQWRTLQVQRRLGPADVEPIPFVIEWAAGTTHPSLDSPALGRLKQIDIFDHEPERLAPILEALGVSTPVRVDRECRLRAVLETPKGLVTIG